MLFAIVFAPLYFSAVKAASFCEKWAGNTQATLSCPTGEIISKVYFMSWGRPSDCPNPSKVGRCHAISSDTDLHWPDYTPSAATRCLNKNSCSYFLTGTNQIIGGDPCAGQAKWMVAKWECSICSADTENCLEGTVLYRLPEKNCQFDHTTCPSVLPKGCAKIWVDDQGRSTETISCPAGQIINKINFVSYGTQPNGFCTKDWSHSSTCGVDRRAWVFGECINKNSCTMTPTGGSNGNVGVINGCSEPTSSWKYLWIEYECGTSQHECPCTFYQHCNYGGTSHCIWKDTSSLPSNQNDYYSSVKVLDGFTCKIHEHSNFSGKVHTFSGDDSCFTNEEWCSSYFIWCTNYESHNDKTSSVKVNYKMSMSIISYNQNTQIMAIGGGAVLVSFFGILGFFGYKYKKSMSNYDEYEQLLSQNAV